MQMEPWQRLILEALQELSDASFQDRAWRRREGSEISSPNEVVNQLFDDSGLGDLLEDGLVFSEQADSTLQQLSRYIDTIDFERPVDDLLVDERWTKVRELAAQARAEVHAALHSSFKGSSGGHE